MGRLFWKFFAFFWLAQLTSVVGVGVTFWLRNEMQQRIPDAVDASPPAAFHSAAAAATLRHGGIDALRSLLEESSQDAGQLAGMGNSLRIAIEAKNGDIFDPEYLDTVKKISDELFLYPGVDRPYMKSLWTPSVRWTGVTEEGLDGGPVVPDDYDGSPESLAQVRLNVERSGEIGQLVERDSVRAVTPA